MLMRRVARPWCQITGLTRYGQGLNFNKSLAIQDYPMFSVGYGKYTEERRSMVDSMTLDDIFSGIEEMKKMAEAREALKILSAY